jgi:hypothetical protein
MITVSGGVSLSTPRIPRIATIAAIEMVANGTTRLILSHCRPRCTLNIKANLLFPGNERWSTQTHIELGLHSRRTAYEYEFSGNTRANSQVRSLERSPLQTPAATRATLREFLGIGRAHERNKVP